MGDIVACPSYIEQLINRVSQYVSTQRRSPCLLDEVLFAENHAIASGANDIGHGIFGECTSNCQKALLSAILELILLPTSASDTASKLLMYSLHSQVKTTTSQLLAVAMIFASLPKVYHQKLYSSVIDIICQVNLDDLPFSLLPDCTWAEDCYTGTLLSRALTLLQQFFHHGSVMNINIFPSFLEFVIQGC